MKIKNSLYYIISLLSYYTGFSSVINRLNSSKGTFILTYHKIKGQRFEKHIKYLRKHYEIIPLDKMVNSIKGSSEIPENSIVITFDDGYKSNYSEVFPVLKKHNIPATVYLTTDIIGTNEKFWWTKVRELRKLSKNKKSVSVPKNSYLKSIPEEEKRKIIKDLTEKLDYNPKRREALNWEEVKEMHESGLVTFGAHTHTHPILTNVSLKKAKEEIRKSKEKIESKLDIKVKHFAYPNGDFNNKIVELVKNEGFKSAVTSLWGFNNGATNLFKLKRVPVRSYWEKYRLSSAIIGYRSKLRKLLRAFP